VTRARIGEAVWQDAPDELTNLVDVHVGHLRRKIEVRSASPVIETVRGRGFRLVGAPA